MSKSSPSFQDLRQSLDELEACVMLGGLALPDCAECPIGCAELDDIERRFLAMAHD